MVVHRVLSFFLFLRKHFLFFSLFLVGHLFLSFAAVWAMDVRPPVLEVSAKPGESSGAVFFLSNTETVTQTYSFAIQGFVAQGDEGRQEFLPVSETKGLPSWLYLREPRISLEAGKSVAVPILFRPPLDAEAGAYQAVIFASVLGSRKDEAVRLGSRVGVLIFATVEGDLLRSLVIRSARRVSPFFSLSSLPLFEVVLTNQGQAHEFSMGQLKIKNIFGHVVESVSLSSVQLRSIRILPGSERRLSLRPKMSMDGWGWGVYRAEVILDEPFATKADAGWFFVLPWKTLSVVFGGIVVWYFLRKRFR